MLMLRKVALLSVIACWTLGASAQQTRHFTFHYEFTVRNIAPGVPVRVWIPLARSDEFQIVRVISTSGDLPLKKTQEKEYGNWMLYASTAKATRPEYKFSADYDVVRREHLSAQATVKPVALPPRERHRFFKPTILLPITGLHANFTP